jgi:hypothetical protein
LILGILLGAGKYSLEKTRQFPYDIA